MEVLRCHLNKFKSSEEFYCVGVLLRLCYSNNGRNKWDHQSGCKPHVRVWGGEEGEEGVSSNHAFLGTVQNFRLVTVLTLTRFFFGIFREASDRALKGSLLELVEDIFCAAEKEARRTGNDASMPRGLVSPAYPEMTFDAAEFQRFSKREEGLPNKIKELLRIPEDDRTLDQIQNVSITTNY